MKRLFDQLVTMIFLAHALEPQPNNPVRTQNNNKINAKPAVFLVNEFFSRHCVQLQLCMVLRELLRADRATSGVKTTGA